MKKLNDARCNTYYRGALSTISSSYSMYFCYLYSLIFCIKNSIFYAWNITEGAKLHTVGIMAIFGKGETDRNDQIKKFWMSRHEWHIISNIPAIIPSTWYFQEISRKISFWNFATRQRVRWYMDENRVQIEWYLANMDTFWERIKIYRPMQLVTPTL